jgi:hypothetical protein
MRPIDLQDNLSKAPLAGREQTIQQNSADLAQRAGAQELNREHLLNQTRTTESAASDAADNRVDDDDEGRGGQDRRDGRRRRKDERHEEGAPAPSRSAYSREIDLTA